MRPSIEFVRAKFGTGDIAGVEVGVYYGEHAKEMLDGLPNLKKLFLVDPYVPYDERQVPIIGEVALDAARTLLEPYSDRLGGQRQTSLEAAKTCPDDHVEFVYLDADHRYGPTLDDMMAWWKKIKIGGILAGHDFRSYASVREAVIDFADAHGKLVMFKDNDWWIIRD